MIRRLLLGYVAIILVLSALLAIPFGLVFAQRQRDLFAVGLERDAVVLATVYEDVLQEGRPIDTSVANTYADRTGSRVVVVDGIGVSVIDTEGDVGRSFATRPEIVTALAGDRYSGTRYSGTLDADLFVSAVPVASGSSIFGAVRLTVLNQEVEHAVRRMWLSLFVVVAVAVAASAAVAFAVARSVRRPVAHLSESAERLASGDLTVRASVEDAPHELEELAESFNDMAERLEAMVERQRSFIADASHQLRTPLTALRLRIENLEVAVEGTERQSQVEAISIEVERLSRMVDQLLELSREGVARTETVDAMSTVTDRCSMWQSVAEEAGVDLAVESDDAQCPVLVVPGGLDQILDDLLDNAIRYTDPGGQVTVSVRRGSDERAIIDVSNSGVAITSEDVDRMFDRFWRGTSDSGGSGLGLAIVAYLVERSGGTIHASLSEGSVLTLTVTLRRPDGPGRTR